MADKPMFGKCEFSIEEHAAIQSALKKKLGPAFISQRQGPGGQRLAYIEGWRIINLANELFGFNGWSHSITRETTDFVDHHEGRFFVGVSAHVKITLKDGAYHEDVGYGSSEGMRSKALALEKAKKEAVTDGMKRALKSFGNSLGNCLSDKNYLAQIGRAPKPPAPNLNMKELKHGEEEETVQQARYGGPGGAGRDQLGGHLPPTTPGKVFTRPDLQRRKSMDGSFQSRGPQPGVQARAIGAGDGGHYRSNTHSGLSLAERERLERKQRQLQKQQEFREKMKQSSDCAGKSQPDCSNRQSIGSHSGTSVSANGLCKLISAPLASSTQHDPNRRPDLANADNFDDTGLWDDSQLDHLMSENPNKVEAIMEQAQQVAPPGTRMTPGGMNRNEMSPNTRGRVTRSTAKSPHPKLGGGQWRGRTPIRAADENTNKRRRTDT